MIKNFFLLFCCCAPFCAQSQTMTCSIGGNYTHFLSISEYGHSRNSYTPNIGNSFEINFKDIAYNKHVFGFGLLAERYTGTFDVLSGGLGGSNQMKATVTKTIVGLAIYPLNLKWRQDWHFQLGGLVNYLVQHEIVGSRQTIVMGNITNTRLSNNSIPINVILNVGINASLSYSWEFKKNWSWVPKYSFYASFMGDFINPFEENPRTFKHYLSIGISKRLTE